MSVVVRLGVAEDLEAVNELYREWGYRSSALADDTLVVAEHDRRIVGVVRLVIEEDYLVLRGMRVQPAYQGTGIGSRLLDLAAREIGGRTCYGVPYDHLLPFYARIGFAAIARAEAPGFLIERAESYRAEGLKVAIIRRLAARDPNT